MRTRTKVVSLTQELLDVSDIVSGARILSELLALEEFPDERTAREAPAAIAATLSSVQSRLLLVVSVLSGNNDPARILTSRNDVNGPARSWEDKDVRLAAWADEPRPPKKPAGRRRSGARRR